MIMKAESEAPPEFGPKMRALSRERQRLFVVALYDEEAPDKGDGLQIYAARKAGYGNAEGTSTNAALGVIAARLLADDRVQAAIAEYSRGQVRAVSPEAVRAVRNLVRDPKARDHMKAVSAILDRVDPIETKHVVAVEDHRPPTPEAIDAVLKRIDELMRRVGLPLPPLIIEGEIARDETKT